MITRDDVMDRLVHTDFWHVKGTCTTVCCLIFRSGFTELGWSQCADPKDFDAEKGEKFALADAIDRSLKYIAWEKANQRGA